MKEELLRELVDKTFRNISCPLEGNGVYAELQNAISAAYNLGKDEDGLVPALAPVVTGSEFSTEIQR